MDKTDIRGHLTEIDTRNLVDKAEVKMLEFFVKLELKPGDPIPKEVELAESLGVSRTVIRETLTRLKTIDIIESKKHKGTIIKSPNLGNILQKSMIPNILDHATLRDIFELRLALEVGMADLVVHRITERDIEDLTEIVKIEPARTGKVLFDIDHEVRFHGRLYDITGNNTLKQFQSLLLPVFNYSIESGLINKPVKYKTYVSHKGLVEILKKRDPHAFRTAMRKHLENHYLRILDRE
jgi:DNA-binding FadR family transcriptional regulator